jgi:hypothetical protein
MTELDLAALKTLAGDYNDFGSNVCPAENGPCFACTPFVLAEGVLALLALLTETADALRQIMSMPISERNPDGDEQAAHSMQVVAEDALARLGPLTKEGVND